MLGQIKFEFIFAVVVFAIIIVFAVSQTNILFTAISVDSRTDILKTTTMSVINLLLKDEGEPSNWENNPPNTRWVGLAYSPFALSKQKINQLQNNCGLLDIYNLGEYSLVIYNETHRILFCGYSLAQTPITIVTRYVFVDNGIGNVTLKLW